MTTLLVVLTVAEIVVVVAVLVYYLVQLTREARGISATLGRVAFGVRAVESQTRPIGSGVVRINSLLTEIEAALGPLAEKAESRARR